MQQIIVRQTEKEDIPGLRIVLDETELFPSDMLPILIDNFLSAEPTKDLWFTAKVGNDIVGFCHAVPEQFTDGTWNMLAIAVLPSVQGKGVGRYLVSGLEDRLKNMGQRIIVVDTSGTDDFAKTREFYRRAGYTQQARIRNFWADGDDKVIYTKELTRN